MMTKMTLEKYLTICLVSKLYPVSSIFCNYTKFLVINLSNLFCVTFFMCSRNEIGKYKTKHDHRALHRKSTMLILFRAGSRVSTKLASIALVLLDPKGHQALQVSNKSDKSDKSNTNI